MWASPFLLASLLRLAASGDLFVSADASPREPTFEDGRLKMEMTVLDSRSGSSGEYAVVSGAAGEKIDDGGLLDRPGSQRWTRPGLGCRR